MSSPLAGTRPTSPTTPASPTATPAPIPTSTPTAVRDAARIALAIDRARQLAERKHRKPGLRARWGDGDGSFWDRYLITTSAPKAAQAAKLDAPPEAALAPGFVRPASGWKRFSMPARSPLQVRAMDASKRLGSWLDPEEETAGLISAQRAVSPRCPSSPADPLQEALDDTEAVHRQALNSWESPLARAAPSAEGRGPRRGRDGVEGIATLTTTPSSSSLPAASMAPTPSAVLFAPSTPAALPSPPTAQALGAASTSTAAKDAKGRAGRAGHSGGKLYLKDMKRTQERFAAVVLNDPVADQAARDTAVHMRESTQELEDDDGEDGEGGGGVQRRALVAAGILADPRVMAKHFPRAPPPKMSRHLGIAATATVAAAHLSRTSKDSTTSSSSSSGGRAGDSSGGGVPEDELDLAEGSYSLRDEAERTKALRKWRFFAEFQLASRVGAMRRVPYNTGAPVEESPSSSDRGRSASAVIGGVLLPAVRPADLAAFLPPSSSSNPPTRPSSSAAVARPAPPSTTTAKSTTAGGLNAAQPQIRLQQVGTREASAPPPFEVAGIVCRYLSRWRQSSVTGTRRVCIEPSDDEATSERAILERRRILKTIRVVNETAQLLNTSAHPPLYQRAAAATPDTLPPTSPTLLSPVPATQAFRDGKDSTASIASLRTVPPTAVLPSTATRSPGTRTHFFSSASSNPAPALAPSSSWVGGASRQSRAVASSTVVPQSPTRASGAAASTAALSEAATTEAGEGGGGVVGGGGAKDDDLVSAEALAAMRAYAEVCADGMIVPDPLLAHVVDVKLREDGEARKDAASSAAAKGGTKRGLKDMLKSMRSIGEEVVGIKLDLTNYMVGSKRGSALAMALTVGTGRLRELLVSGNRLGAEAANDVFVVCSTLPRLRVLDIGHNGNIFPSGCVPWGLGDLLSLSSSLREIGLAKSGFGTRVEGVADLVRCLLGCFRLERIDLSENALVDGGCGVEIARLVADHSTLRKLNISWCALADHELAPVASALGKSESLEQFRAACNTWGGRSCAALAAVAHRASHLTVIDLANGQTDAAGALILAAGLARAPALKDLVLRGNLLGSAATELIMGTAARRGWKVALDRCNVTFRDPAILHHFDERSLAPRHYSFDLTDPLQWAASNLLLHRLSETPSLTIEKASLGPNDLRLARRYRNPSTGALMPPLPHPPYPPHTLEKISHQLLRETTKKQPIPTPTTNPAHSSDEARSLSSKGGLKLSITSTTPPPHSGVPNVASMFLRMVHTLQQAILEESERHAIATQCVAARDLPLSYAADLVALGMPKTDPSQRSGASDQNKRLAVWGAVNQLRKGMGARVGLGLPGTLEFEMSLDPTERQLVDERLGQLARFTPSNPTGHYELDLSLENDRELLRLLQACNSRDYHAAVEYGLPDTSQLGTYDNFRNAMLNERPFALTKDFVIPRQGPRGRLVFDYVSTNIPGRTVPPLPPMQEHDVVIILRGLGVLLGVDVAPILRKFHARLESMRSSLRRRASFRKRMEEMARTLPPTPASASSSPARIATSTATAAQVEAAEGLERFVSNTERLATALAPSGGHPRSLDWMWIVPGASKSAPSVTTSGGATLQPVQEGTKGPVLTSIRDILSGTHFQPRILRTNRVIPLPPLAVASSGAPNGPGGGVGGGVLPSTGSASDLLVRQRSASMLSPSAASRTSGNPAAFRSTERATAAAKAVQLAAMESVGMSKEAAIEALRRAHMLRLLQDAGGRIVRSKAMFRLSESIVRTVIAKARAEGEAEEAARPASFHATTQRPSSSSSSSTTSSGAGGMFPTAGGDASASAAGTDRAAAAVAEEPEERKDSLASVALNVVRRLRRNRERMSSSGQEEDLTMGEPITTFGPVGTLSRVDEEERKRGKAKRDRAASLSDHDEPSTESRGEDDGGDGGGEDGPRDSKDEESEAAFPVGEEIDAAFAEQRQVEVPRRKKASAIGGGAVGFVGLRRSQSEGNLPSHASSSSHSDSSASIVLKPPPSHPTHTKPAHVDVHPSNSPPTREKKQLTSAASAMTMHERASRAAEPFQSPTFIPPRSYVPGQPAFGMTRQASGDDLLQSPTAAVALPSRRQLTNALIFLRHMTSVLTVTTQQALDILSCFPSELPDAKLEALIVLFSRLADHRDVWTKLIPSLPSSEERYKACRRLGWLNVFNPDHPDGSYDLDLAVADERALAHILCVLAVAEPGVNVLNEALNGDTAWELPSSWALQVPTQGRLQCTYTSTSMGCLPVWEMRTVLRQKTLLSSLSTENRRLRRDRRKTTFRLRASTAIESATLSSSTWDGAKETN